MDINEVRGLSDPDLESALVDAKQELWKIRFDLATPLSGLMPAGAMVGRRFARRGRLHGHGAGDHDH